MSSCGSVGKILFSDEVSLLSSVGCDDSFELLLRSVTCKKDNRSEKAEVDHGVPENDTGVNRIDKR